MLLQAVSSSAFKGIHVQFVPLTFVFPYKSCLTCHESEWYSIYKEIDKGFSDMQVD